MTALVVHPAARPLSGSVPCPRDEQVAHAALVIAALASGRTRIAGLGAGPGAGERSTVACLRALGVAVEEPSPSEVVIAGADLRPPASALDCGESSAAMALLCGVLAGHPFATTLAGRSRAPRSMAAVATPLRARGASIEGAAGPAGALYPPLIVGPPVGPRLEDLEHESPFASALVKGAVVLSGLFADGATLFKEPAVSPDHVERLLGMLGAPIQTIGPIVRLDPAGWDGRLASFEMALPGDPAAAGLLLAAAQMVEGSRVTVRGVGVNPTRAGILQVARDMGAGMAIEPQGDRTGEPVATVHGWSAPLHAMFVGGEVAAHARGDFAIACALAARARGTTRIVDPEAAEGPRGGAAPSAAASPEDPPPFEAMAGVLRAFGVACELRAGGIEVAGRDGPLDPADVDSGGDPRVAMAAAVLALAARGASRVRDVAPIAATYPKFVATLRALGARIEVEP